MTSRTPLSRRDFFKGAGGLIIGFSLADSSVVPQLLAAQQRGGGPAAVPGAPSAARLDAWLHIEKDGTIRVFTGKVDIGMGVETALAQMVAEELEVPTSRVAMVMGDTSTTVDQGGIGGSNSISGGGRALRNVAATARALLLQMASSRLGVPPDQLEVRNGVVRVKSDTSKTVSYADLAATATFNDTLRPTGNGANLNVEGAGKPKDPSTYTVVGTSVPRADLTEKVLGRFKYITDVKVPGMLHGRIVRPAGVGAKFVSVDEGSVKGISGYVKTVVKGDFVGVVCENEWSAIKAAKALKVTWTAPAAAFPEQKNLYEFMRKATPKLSRETLKRGDSTAGIANAAKKVEASYSFPFQAHATMGPGCAIADVRADGVTTVWTGGQKPHGLQKGYAELMGVAPEKIRVIWVEDAGSYGRPGFEDVGADALLLSQGVGRPVRLQWMRADMTGWGPKGPAAIFDLSAGLDAQGEVQGLEYTSRAFSAGEIHFQPATAGNYLASQLTGIPNKSGFDEFAIWGSEAAAYTFANFRATSHIIPPLHDNPSPLATTHLRDPNGPATTFAVECFMDELAAAAAADPIQFRLKYMTDPKARAVLTAAAEKAGWDPRPSPRKAAARGDLLTGRGIALGYRGGTYIATYADVEVNRRTGAVRVVRLLCAHDCGLIINPDGLTATVTANLIQSMSRALIEEVTFDRNNVTSVDWKTYPIAKMSEMPTQLDVVLLNHPEQAPTGAGEPGTRATSAAIGNAIFDATGARIRQAPFTPARILATL